jgi:hypothetical protein
VEVEFVFGISSFDGEKMSYLFRFICLHLLLSMCNVIRMNMIMSINLLDTVHYGEEVLSGFQPGSVVLLS